MVASNGRQSRLTYGCHRQRIEYAGMTCQSLAGQVLDDLVSQQVLHALEPAALEMRLLGQRPRYQEGPPEGAGSVRWPPEGAVTWGRPPWGQRGYSKSNSP